MTDLKAYAQQVASRPGPYNVAQLQQQGILVEAPSLAAEADPAVMLKEKYRRSKASAQKWLTHAPGLGRDLLLDALGSLTLMTGGMLLGGVGGKMLLSKLTQQQAAGWKKNLLVWGGAALTSSAGSMAGLWAAWQTSRTHQRLQ
ncbi:MAG: hypothetical protein SFZ03_03045 [Candidatus Melainabacteria bacterium]|nr:hypothetical protein [Candidatus Melainabacteria bacterium]